MSEQTFDASGLLAQATQIQQQAQAETRAGFQRALDNAKAQALAAPGGGAYAADGPALSVQGALPMPPGFIGAFAQFIYQHAAPHVVSSVAQANVANSGILGHNAIACTERVAAMKADRGGLPLPLVMLAAMAVLAAAFLFMPLAAFFWRK